MRTSGFKSSSGFRFLERYPDARLSAAAVVIGTGGIPRVFDGSV